MKAKKAPVVTSAAVAPSAATLAAAASGEWRRALHARLVADREKVEIFLAACRENRPALLEAAEAAKEDTRLRNLNPLNRLSSLERRLEVAQVKLRHLQAEKPPGAASGGVRQRWKLRLTKAENAVERAILALRHFKEEHGI